MQLFSSKDWTTAVVLLRKILCICRKPNFKGFTGSLFRNCIPARDELVTWMTMTWDKDRISHYQILWISAKLCPEVKPQQQQKPEYSGKRHYRNLQWVGRACACRSIHPVQFSSIKWNNVPQSLPCCSEQNTLFFKVLHCCFSLESLRVSVQKKKANLEDDWTVFQQ